jgi:hypothetical protein
MEDNQSQQHCTDNDIPDNGQQIQSHSGKAQGHKGQENTDQGLDIEEIAGNAVFLKKNQDRSAFARISEF